MRGSPLIRSILLALALFASGGVLMRLTSAKNPAAAEPPPDATAIAQSGTIASPYRLLLSAPAAELRIGPGSATPAADAASALSGTLELDPANPQLALFVRWVSPPGEHETRFAKLILEIPGRPTFSHVFDARSDIDDFLELPALTAP